MSKYMGMVGTARLWQRDNALTTLYSLACLANLGTIADLVFRGL